MMEPASSRPYRMRARAEAAARTADSILAATAALWRERSVDEITLELIAERAEVSVRTVIRRFGSRAGVITALIEVEGARITAERGEAPVGNVEGALDVLLRHYERDGLAVLRTLALEDKVPEAKTIVERGRAEHRAWCARIFAPRLPDQGQRARLVQPHHGPVTGHRSARASARCAERRRRMKKHRAVDWTYSLNIICECGDIR
jgi:AcrR family transcriptional regulator